MTAAPPPSRARRTSRLRVRIAAIAAALVLTLAPVIPAAAETPTPTPTPTPTAGTAEFTLAPVGRGILNPGDALAVSITMQNGTAFTTGGGTVDLRLGVEPLADRTELAAWLAGEAEGIETSTVASDAFPAVAPGGENTNGVLVDAADPALADLAPGVHAILATLQTPTRTFTSRSVVVVPATDPRALGIGVVVPITAGPIATGLLTSQQLATLTADDGALTDQLAAVAGTDAILAVDPAIAAAIRVLGTSAPASAVAWLDELMSLPNPRFALQFGDADAATEVQAGITPPLAPTSLKSYLTARDFPTATPTPTPTTTPTADPTATPDSTPATGPAYPDLTELLDIGTARAGVFWPPTGTVGTGVATSLGALTVDGQSGVTLVASTSTTTGADAATVTARGAVEGAGVLVYDEPASSELYAASIVEESALRGAHLAAATAYLTFAAADADGAPVLVTVDRGDARSRVGLRTAIQTALEVPGAEPYTLGGLVNSPADDVELIDPPVDEARVDAASALVDDESAIDGFATILADPGVLKDPERAEILQLLGAAWLPDAEAWATAVTAHREGSAATLNSVGIVPPSTIQLISSNAGIPVWIRNDLPWPVAVDLLASPDDLRLEVQHTTAVAAQASSNTRVEIPVEARLGNATVTVDLSLRSTAGVPIGQPQELTVNVRAEWEAIGLAIVITLAAGLVAVGVFRTIRRRRAAASEATRDPNDDAPTAADTAPAPDAPPAAEPDAEGHE